MAVPVTGYTELDLVGFTDKGTYNAATTYVANDLVSYNGIKWKCLQDGTVGVTPAEGVSWSVFIIDNEINDNAVSATSTWSSQKINTTKADQTAIAPVENGTTASRAYAIGEHFMKDGAFCTAIAAIAQGATFTLDTNYTAGTVGEGVETMMEEVQEEITDLKNTIILRAGDTGVGVGNRISLSDNMSNYRFILMKTRGSDNKDGSVFIPVTSIINYMRVVGTYGDSVGVYRFSLYSDNNISFDVAPESSVKIYQVFGYK